MAHNHIKEPPPKGGALTKTKIKAPRAFSVEEAQEMSLLNHSFGDGPQVQLSDPS